MSHTPYILFCVDSSTLMGSGHLMRCLTLADMLRDNSATSAFICRSLPGAMLPHLGKLGYKVHLLPYDAGHPLSHSWLGTDTATDIDQTRAVVASLPAPDWLVVDHYLRDARFESSLRPLVGQILVIDDLADRPHDCDLLLDQNLYHDMAGRYLGLVPDHCRLLLGPSHALLRPQFRALRPNAGGSDGRIRRVLVFFGGSDPSNETEKALAAMETLADLELFVDVVVGASNPHQAAVRARCGTQTRFSYHCQVGNMAELMAASQLMIGAGGSTTWERCSLGVPSITVVVAENQSETTRAVADAGATWYLGRSEEVTSQDIAAAVRELWSDPLRVRAMASRALEIMGSPSDGGGCELAEVMMGDSYAAS